MRIVYAGHQRTALQIDHLRVFADKSLHIGIRARYRNPVTDDAQRLQNRILRVNRYHFSVQKSQIQGIRKDCVQRIPPLFICLPRTLLPLH